MGLHVLALANLHFQVANHGLKPVVVGFACPLILKLLMGFRFFKDDALHQSRVFLFQLGHIAFNREHQLSNVARMERALRLIWRTLTPNPEPPSSSENNHVAQQSLHDLSMLSL